MRNQGIGLRPIFRKHTRAHGQGSKKSRPAYVSHCPGKPGRMLTLNIGNTSQVRSLSMFIGLSISCMGVGRGRG